MKSVRMLSRIILISLAAAAFAGLTGIYGGWVQPPLPEPGFRAAHRDRPPAPQLDQFLEFVGAGLGFAIFAMGGRLVLRLRLTPVPRREGQPVSLGLQRGREAN